MYDCAGPRRDIFFFVRERDINKAFDVIEFFKREGIEVTPQNIRKHFPYKTNRQVAQILSINKNGRPKKN